MRGKELLPAHCPERRGITPALAGKSWMTRRRAIWCTDHPRTCGEKCGLSATTRGQKGSPPHMRGKVHRVAIGAVGAGITPAHAGKSKKRRFARARARDHPRSCGEKPLETLFVSHRSGSPPHMRGKEAPATPDLGQLGITPAHAGKRCRPPEFSSQCRDHPRVCGEKVPRQGNIVRNKGSPPHLRGKVKAVRFSAHFFRITPAHAGKSTL